MWVFGVVAFFLSLIPYRYDPPHFLDSSVVIETQDGHGSGVFIGPRMVLTAKHVTEHLEDGLRVRGPEGDIYQIVSVSAGPADIAILIVDRDLRGGTPRQVSCNPPSRGDMLHYYGSPLDIEFTGPIDLKVIMGKIPEEADPAITTSTILVEGEAEPGSSGSGVINEAGKVVGVYNFAWTGTNFGGFVSLSYPDVCSWITRELTPEENA